MNKVQQKLKAVVGCFALVLLMQLQSPQEERPERLLLTIPEENLKFVGFWHIGASRTAINKTRDEFVMMQAHEILDSPLFSEASKFENVTINYVTRLDLSNETKQFLQDTNVIHELKPTAIPDMKDDDEYFEFPTLAEVHNFCLQPENRDTVAFYIHSKTVDTTRKELEGFLLSERCAQCMQDERKVACGPNWISETDFLWQHFSGNMWMARCSHVAQLNFPFQESILDDNRAGMGFGTPHLYPPSGRYLAEWWVLNDSGTIGPSKPATELDGVNRKGLLDEDQICSSHGRAFARW